MIFMQNFVHFHTKYTLQLGIEDPKLENDTQFSTFFQNLCGKN